MITIWAIVALILAVPAVIIGRWLGRPRLEAPPALFDHPAPMARSIPAEPDLHRQIGKVLSDGMDRVDAMRAFGADRFLTFMPMPDGTWWSVTVVRHPDEAAAKGSYPRVPAVVH